MTSQADWVKELRDNVNYDEAELGCNWGMDELENFISKVESLAQQRTEKKWREKCENWSSEEVLVYQPDRISTHAGVANGWRQYIKDKLSDLLK